MSSRSCTTHGRSLLRLAVVGAVVAGAPVALAGTAGAAPESAWDRLAQCESGGNWNTNSGNGYFGGIQFNARTWKAFGGSGMPHQASKAEQIAVAERTLAAQGWNAWPACSRKMGLRGTAAVPPAARKASAPASAAKAVGSTRSVKVRSGKVHTVKRAHHPRRHHATARHGVVHRSVHH